jgi:hypothetical protein
METFYYKDRSGGDKTTNNSVLVFKPPQGVAVNDFLIDYYAGSVEKVCKIGTYSFLFLYIVVIIIYIFALSNILLVKIIPKKNFLTDWIEKYMPFILNEEYAIIFLFFSTLLTSFISGYTLIFFFLTSIIFILLSIHKSKCNGLIRWPLFFAGIILLLFVVISSFGSLFSYATIFIDLFKYTTILSFICVLLDYKIFLQKKCISLNK